MDQPVAFVLAVAALLSVPGPTNTLLAASGAAIGVRASPKLIPAEIAGYLIAIGCLLAVVAPIAASHPMIPVASKLIASAYLAWLAVQLWRDGGAELIQVPPPASPGRLFLTTLLNPKALIPNIGVCVPTAICWGALGWASIPYGWEPPSRYWRWSVAIRPSSENGGCL